MVRVLRRPGALMTLTSMSWYSRRQTASPAPSPGTFTSVRDAGFPAAPFETSETGLVVYGLSAWTPRRGPTAAPTRRRTSASKASW
jgi:hypothetical protein